MDRTDTLGGDSPEEARRRLSRRLVVAGVLIVILLGALAMFDHLSRLQDEEPMPAQGPASGPGPSVRTDPSYPVGAPPPPPIAPSVAEAGKPEPPPQPDVAAQPVLPPAPPAASRTEPAPPTTTRPVPTPVAVPEPAAKPETPAPAPPAAVPEGTAGGEIKPAPAGALGPAQSPGVPVVPARPVLPQLKRGYVLQAGVFTSSERAEELRARLVMAGVPVTVESRVQVGPFATAQEAAAAREKIKALGVESILIPPARARAAGR